MSDRPRGDRLALLSFILIVPALATFIVGLASSGTLPLYISLGCSIVAGLSLAAGARLRRRDVDTADATLLAPVAGDELEEEEEEVPAVVLPAATATHLTEDTDAAPDEAWAPEPADFALEVEAPRVDPPEPPPTPAQAKRKKKRRPSREVVLPPPAPPPAPSRPAAAVTYDDEGALVFPIEDYDGLSAAQVVKVLKLLDSEEMETVREFEAANQARPEVLERIDRLLASRGLV